MFDKYYGFIGKQLDGIGYFSKNTTIANYLKSVIGGLLLILISAATIGAISIIIMIPHLLISVLIYKPIQLAIEDVNKKLKELAKDKTIINMKIEINKDIKEMKKKTSEGKYSSDKVRERELNKISKRKDDLEMLLYKQRDILRVYCKEVRGNVIEGLVKNIKLMVGFMLLYLPVVIPFLFILYDFTLGESGSSDLAGLLAIVVLTIAAMLIIVMPVINTIELLDILGSRYNDFETKPFK